MSCGRPQPAGRLLSRLLSASLLPASVEQPRRPHSTLMPRWRGGHPLRPARPGAAPAAQRRPTTSADSSSVTSSTSLATRSRTELLEVVRVGAVPRGDVQSGGARLYFADDRRMIRGPAHLLHVRTRQLAALGREGAARLLFEQLDAARPRHDDQVEGFRLDGAMVVILLRRTHQVRGPVRTRVRVRRHPCAGLDRSHPLRRGFRVGRQQPGRSIYCHSELQSPMTISWQSKTHVYTDRARAERSPSFTCEVRRRFQLASSLQYPLPEIALLQRGGLWPSLPVVGGIPAAHHRSAKRSGFVSRNCGNTARNAARALQVRDQAA